MLTGKFSRSIAVALVSLCTLAVQQAEAQQRPVFGFQGGVNVATVTGDFADALEATGSEVKSKTGFVGGLWASLPISPTVAIEPELLYSQKGFKTEGTVNTETELNYFEVPILVNFLFKSEGSFRPGLFIGPAFGFKTSCNVSSASIEIDCEDEATLDAITEDVEVSLVFGLGSHIDLGSGELLISGRFTLGLSSLVASELDSNLKNRVGPSIRVGYGFPIGR